MLSQNGNPIDNYISPMIKTNNGKHCQWKRQVNAKCGARRRQENSVSSFQISYILRKCSHWLSVRFYCQGHLTQVMHPPELIRLSTLTLLNCRLLVYANGTVVAYVFAIALQWINNTEDQGKGNPFFLLVMNKVWSYSFHLFNALNISYRAQKIIEMFITALCRV